MSTRKLNDCKTLKQFGHLNNIQCPCEFISLSWLDPVSEPISNTSVTSLLQIKEFMAEFH